jgi:hypothetical protein
MVSTSGSEEATCDKFDEKKSGSRLLSPTKTLISTSSTDGRRGNRIRSMLSVQNGAVQNTDTMAYL